MNHSSDDAAAPYHNFLNFFRGKHIPVRKIQDMEIIDFHFCCANFIRERIF